MHREVTLSFLRRVFLPGQGSSRLPPRLLAAAERRPTKQPVHSHSCCSLSSKSPASGR